MNKQYDILVNGAVSGKSNEYYECGHALGSFEDRSRVHALRSLMLQRGIRYIELAYVGHFKDDGSYIVRLYQEVFLDDEDDLCLDSFDTIYHSTEC